MEPRDYRLSRLTWPEVDKVVKDGYNTVIVPIGVLEAHGPHLPLGTDFLIPEGIALEIAPKIKALISPAIHTGVVRSLTWYPGSCGIEPETFESLVYEFLSGLSRHGFKYFVILNGHGSGDHLTSLRNALRRLWIERSRWTILVNWWIYARNLTKKIYGKMGGHAGTDETAMIYFYHPDCVVMSQYDSKEILLVEDGIDVFPSPGSILNYSESEGDVLFDPKKAKAYHDDLIDLLTNRLSDLLDRMRGKEGEKNLDSCL